MNLTDHILLIAFAAGLLHLIVQLGISRWHKLKFQFLQGFKPGEHE